MSFLVPASMDLATVHNLLEHLTGGKVTINAIKPHYNHVSHGSGVEKYGQPLKYRTITDNQYLLFVVEISSVACKHDRPFKPGMSLRFFCRFQTGHITNIINTYFSLRQSLVDHQFVIWKMIFRNLKKKVINKKNVFNFSIQKLVLVHRDTCAGFRR